MVMFRVKVWVRVTVRASLLFFRYGTSFRIEYCRTGVELILYDRDPYTISKLSAKYQFCAIHTADNTGLLR